MEILEQWGAGAPQFLKEYWAWFGMTPGQAIGLALSGAAVYLSLSMS